jgi:hypothetical protein
MRIEDLINSVYSNKISADGLLKTSIPWRKAANPNSLIGNHAFLIRELSQIKNQQNELKNLEYENLTCNLIIMVIILILCFILFKNFITKSEMRLF